MSSCAENDVKTSLLRGCFGKVEHTSNFYVQCTTQRVYSKRDLFKILTSMNIARDHNNRIIHRFIELYRQCTRFICMFTRMTWLFHKVIVL